MSLTGRILGGFLVKEPIGEGGFGTVYRAEQPLLEREAVIKVLHARHRSDKAIVARFLREARLASRLDHPYAAHIYAFGAETDGLLWLAMEYVRGTPLSTVLRSRGTLSLAQLVPLVERLCEVVATAHEQRIVHRDIKPANVMVIARAGRYLPKLLDLGIAKMLADSPDDAAEAPTRAPAAVAMATPPSLEDSAPDDGLAARLGRSTQVFVPPITPPAPTPPHATPNEPSTLTQEGAAMGSPAYMPPEQWRGESVDARADLYALGVLTFEALTGRVPFQGCSLHEYQAAHLDAPVPALAEELPAALHDVLARALAKRPADRFATALEFAAALRRASGLDQAAEPPTPLDEALRGAFMARAPRPLADAIALVDGAGTAAQASDAIRHAARLVTRLLLVLALAARTRAARDEDAPALLELLRDLRRRELDERQWLDLARELLRGFAGIADAHPLPELVDFFYPRDQRAPAALALAELVGAHASAERLLELDQRSHHDALLARFETVLHALAFLNQVPLVAIDDAGVAHSLAGARRVLAHLPAPPTRVALQDARGQTRLVLSPLAQLVAPAPGEPPELFLFAGRARQGARLVASPLGFERVDVSLWDWFGSQIGEVDAVDASERAPAEASPYPGLAPYGVEDAARYVGREREIESLLNRLRREPLVVVAGPSGSGKSSFVRAGLAASLPPGWRAVVLRPGDMPLLALAGALRGLGEDAALDALAARLATYPAGFGGSCRALAAARGETFVVVVDQLEELVTLASDLPARTAFAAAIAGAARTADDGVRVVATVRDDFLARVEALAPFRDRLARALVLLRTPAPEDLLRILVEPTRRAGYGFDDAELAGEMVAAVAGRPGALALLSFTASRLWDLRDPGFRVLTRRAHDALGGVGGALAAHAEATLAQLPAEEQRGVREAFRHLVTADGTRAVLSRDDLEQSLGGGARGAAVLARLLDARLVVTHESAEGDRIEIVHETLLSAWPRLVAWRAEDAEGLRLREQLHAAARQWDERGRDRGLYWRGEALLELEHWRVRTNPSLTATERAFADGSAAEAARQRRVRVGAVVTAFAALALGVIGLGFVNHRAVLARSAAQKSDRAAQASDHAAQALVTGLLVDQGRQALLDGDPGRAIAPLAQAYQRGERGLPLRFLLARATRALEAERLVLPQGGYVLSVAFSPDGRRVLTGGSSGTARLWDASDGHLLAALAGHQGKVLQVAFSDDGGTILTSGDDGTVRLWSAEGDARTTIAAAAGRGVVARMGPGGALVAVGTLEGRVALYRPDGTTVRTLSAAGPAIRWVELARDGERLVAASKDGGVRLWRVSDGALLASFAHGGPVTRALLAPDGARLVTTGLDGVARVWDEHGRPLLTLRGHGASIEHAAFDPGGARLVTASADHTARIWNLDDGTLAFVLSGHPGGVKRALFTRDGRQVVTAGLDGTVRVWDAANGRQRAVLAGHHAQVFTLDLAGAGERVVSGSADGSARVWQIPPDDLALTTSGPGQPLWSVDVDATGEHVLLTGDGGDAAIVRLADGVIERTLPPVPKLTSARFDRLGERIVTASRDGKARVFAREGKLLLTVDHGAPLTRALFSPDGTLLATAGADGRVRSFRAADGTPVATMVVGAGDVDDLDFNPGGDVLAATGQDGTIAIFEPRRGARLRTLTLPSRIEVIRVRWSADGTRLATGSGDHVVRVWDAASGTLRTTLEGHGDEVMGVAFSPDGALVASSSNDLATLLWDATTGHLLASFEADSDGVNDVVFTPDGGRLVTVSGDHLAHVWQLRYETRAPDEIDAIAARARR